MNEIERRKLDKLLADRPKIEKVSQNQIDAVKDVLVDGWYIDFNWALNHCSKTQRLGAIIYVLRHMEGMPIVEWQPTLYGGSVYSLYDYAPEEVRNAWKFLEGKTADEIKYLDFSTGRRLATQNSKDVIEGQISIFDAVMESLDE